MIYTGQDGGFWLVAIALGLAVFAILWLAARRGAGTTLSRSSHDLTVYRDQLQEIQRDMERGVLLASEAQAARAEVARRMLALDRAAQTRGQRAERDVAKTTAAGGAMAEAGVPAIFAGLVVICAVLVYLRIGVPGYEDQPLAARHILSEEIAAARPPLDDIVPLDPPESLAPALQSTLSAEEREYAQLTAQLRQALAQEGEADVQGLALLALAEARMGRYRAAMEAQTRLIEQKSQSNTLLSSDLVALAELQIAAAQGMVTAEAEAILREALRLDPVNGAARYLLGSMYIQIGRFDITFRLWNPLLAEGPEQAPWIPPIRARIDDIAALAGIPRYTQPQPRLRGPSADDLAAIQEMTDEERTAMIEAMVDRLAQRLANEGGSASEWAQLINALGILGRKQELSAIYQEATDIFAETPEALRTIEEAARRARMIP